MIISPAFADENTAVVASTAQNMASTADPIVMNIGMILLLAVTFYVLLIRPQQKRFKQHAEMIGKLDKGTKVVTQGGLVGTIEKVVSDHEVQIDFGNGVKMNMMRSYVIGRYEEVMPKDAKPANDTVNSKKDTSSK